MKEIKRYFESRIGNYSFYFEDFNSGYVYGYNENVKMTAAGCMKLPIAIALLKEVQNSNFNLQDKILISKILHEKKYLNPELSDMLTGILKRQQLKSKSALYIPDELKSNIANKTGDKKAVENDTMFINIEKGTFAFSVMSNEIPNSVYGIVTIAKAGKMMWDNITNYWS